MVSLHKPFSQFDSDFEIIGKYDFPYHLKKIIVRKKKIDYNIDLLRQTVCLFVIPIKVNNFAYLFDCTTVGRASN